MIPLIPTSSSSSSANGAGSTYTTATSASSSTNGNSLGKPSPMAAPYPTLRKTGGFGVNGASLPPSSSTLHALASSTSSNSIATSASSPPKQPSSSYSNTLQGTASMASLSSKSTSSASSHTIANTLTPALTVTNTINTANSLSHPHTIDENNNTSKYGQYKSSMNSENSYNTKPVIPKSAPVPQPAPKPILKQHEHLPPPAQHPRMPQPLSDTRYNEQIVYRHRHASASVAHPSNAPATTQRVPPQPQPHPQVVKPASTTSTSATYTKPTEIDTNRILDPRTRSMLHVTPEYDPHLLRHVKQAPLVHDPRRDAPPRVTSILDRESASKPSGFDVPQWNSTTLLTMEQERIRSESFDPQEALGKFAKEQPAKVKEMRAKVTAQALNVSRDTSVFRDLVRLTPEVEPTDTLVMPRAPKILSMDYITSLAEKPNLELLAPKWTESDIVSLPFPQQIDTPEKFRPLVPRPSSYTLELEDYRREGIELEKPVTWEEMVFSKDPQNHEWLRGRKLYLKWKEEFGQR